MKKKIRGSISFSSIGLCFIFLFLLQFFYLAYQKEVVSQLRLKNYYVAKSLSYFCMKDYDVKESSTQVRYFKEGKVELQKIRERVKITIEIGNDSFIFMEPITKITTNTEETE